LVPEHAEEFQGSPENNATCDAEPAKEGCGFQPLKEEATAARRIAPIQTSMVEAFQRANI